MQLSPARLAAGEELVPLADTRAPTPADLVRWRTADEHARPGRLERLRARLADEGCDAWFGVRAENVRYLTGFELADGEERVAGVSGHVLVAADETIVLADSRYRLQAREQCPTSRVEDVYGDLPDRWPALVRSLAPIADGPAGGVGRIGVEAAHLSHAAWLRLAAALPQVELVPADGWVEELRQTKEPAELERIAAACHVADRALEHVLADARAGETERELALALEWRMRTTGAEALAFDVACLGGPRAALPHGSPTGRRLREGEVLLLDFGAMVDGYRSDMTRTLFVGEPRPRDLTLHDLVARAQAAAFAMLAEAAATGASTSNRAVDAAARAVIEEAGHGDHFGHGLGHGIGLATHEAPSLGRWAIERPLPAPTVFSVEPGVYLDDETGVRIEDLVLFDPGARRLERLTRFPRGVIVLGA